MSTLKVNTLIPVSGDTINVDGNLTVGGESLSGFPYTGSAAITGSLIVTGSDDLAVRVSGSTALTGSLFVSGTISGSFSGSGVDLTGITTASFASTGDGIFSGSFSGSFEGDGTNLTGVASPTGSYTGSFTGSMLVDDGSGSFSGSFEGDGSNLTGVGGFPHTGSADITGSLIVTGSAFVTSLTETSAERFKTNITNLDSQIDNISLLTPVSFNWKEDNREDIGLIAEEINEIYPEFIGKNPNGEIQGIKYSKLTAVLVKSIQELNEKNKELELRIKQLENKK